MLSLYARQLRAAWECGAPMVKMGMQDSALEVRRVGGLEGNVSWYMIEAGLKAICMVTSNRIRKF